MKWEYQYAEFPLNPGSPEAESGLNDLGSQGWEVVMLSQGFIGQVIGQPKPVWLAWLKRRVPEYNRANCLPLKSEN